ncbi:MAG: IPT/TIG domain-containing protein [Candidatus Dormibacteria bacterium]
MTYDQEESRYGALKTAELYDPLVAGPSGAAGRWSYAPAMDTPRGIHSATLLEGSACRRAADRCGTVLIAGGATNGPGMCSFSPQSGACPPPLASASLLRPGPELTSIEPTSGPSTGGTKVELKGTSLRGVTRVTFDGVPATNVISDSPTHVTASAPPHGSGSAEVAVITTAGDSRPAPADYGSRRFFTYSSCNVAPAASQVPYPAGYSLIGLPGGLHVASDYYRYGWFNLGGGNTYSSEVAANAVTEAGHGYWAYFSCARPVDLVQTGSTPEASVTFQLGAYHASMLGNPSRSGPASVTGHDFAAAWEPAANGGAGAYRISGYQEAQSLAVGSGTWVFSYRDTTIQLQAPAA